MTPRFVLAPFALLTFCGCLFAQPAPSPHPAASSTTISATFWNVQWVPGRRPNASRSEENREIHAVPPGAAQLNSESVAFEEVRDYEHAALAVKSLAGFKVDVCSNFPPREG